MSKLATLKSKIKANAPEIITYGSIAAVVGATTALCVYLYKEDTKLEKEHIERLAEMAEGLKTGKLKALVDEITGKLVIVESNV